MPEIDIADLSFLYCHRCGAGPVDVHSDSATACASGHFLCPSCAPCPCGQETRIVLEPEFEFTKTAPWYTHRLVHSCQNCSFRRLNKHALDAHACFCEEPYHRHVKKQRRVLKTDTDTILLENPTVVYELHFPDCTILWEPHRVTFQDFLNYHWFSASSQDSIVYGFTHNGPTTHSFTGPTRVTARKLFQQPPTDPATPYVPEQPCSSFVSTWWTRLDAALRDAAIEAMKTGKEMVGPQYPTFVNMYDKTAVYDLVCRTRWPDQYKGGFLFTIGAFKNPENPSENTNAFTFWVFELDRDPLILCPGCLNPFKFSGPISSFCEHIGVSEQYIRYNAVRLLNNEGMPIPQIHMNPCARRLHGCDLNYEVLPYYRRDELQPHTGGYGHIFNLGCRKRLVVIGEDLTCTHCSETFSSIQELSRHFDIPVELIECFQRMVFNATGDDYEFETEHTLLKK